MHIYEEQIIRHQSNSVTTPLPPQINNKKKDKKQTNEN
jgi:hypothetical protein